MALIIILEIASLLFLVLFLSVILLYRKKLVWVFLSGVLFSGTTSILVYIVFVVFSTYGIGVKSENRRIVKIERGSSLSEIGKVLFKDGVIDSQKEFVWISKLFGYEKKLKTGKYEIPGETSYYYLLRLLYSGENIQEKITIPEGSRTEKIASILQEKIGIDEENFISLLNDQSFIRSFGLETPSLDGFLLPETYNLYWGMNEQEIITIFIKEFKKILTDSVITNISESEFTLRDYVILASIIEGEAVHNEERSIISAVFHNRLRLNIRLQADPTIQYIISDGPRRLLNEDLEIDSPYNTYRYGGLPPGPICNPGRKSILAAIYPANEDYLYFVARGDGYHTFSRNTKEHFLAKRKLDELRRQLKREQKLNE